MVKTMPDKIASALSYSASGGLVIGGWRGWFEWLHGLDWNFLGLSGGLIIGVATFAVNAYYKRKEDSRRESAHNYDIEQDRLRTEAIQDFVKRSTKLENSEAPEVIAALNETLKKVES